LFDIFISILYNNVKFNILDYENVRIAMMIANNTTIEPKIIASLIRSFLDFSASIASVYHPR
jgi:hypothetical protein